VSSLTARQFSWDFPAAEEAFLCDKDTVLGGHDKRDTLYIENVCVTYCNFCSHVCVSMFENIKITECGAVVHEQMAVAQLAIKFCVFYRTHKFIVVIHNNISLRKHRAANFLVLPFSLLVSDNRREKKLYGAHQSLVCTGDVIFFWGGEQIINIVETWKHEET
jgi:hypothetical protein